MHSEKKSGKACGIIRRHGKSRVLSGPKFLICRFDKTGSTASRNWKINAKPNSLSRTRAEGLGIRLRAERKAGQLIATIEKVPGRRC